MISYSGRPDWRAARGLREDSLGRFFEPSPTPELGPLCDPRFGVSPYKFQRNGPKIGATKRPQFWGQEPDHKVHFHLRPGGCRQTGCHAHVQPMSHDSGILQHTAEAPAGIVAVAPKLGSAGKLSVTRRRPQKRGHNAPPN